MRRIVPAVVLTLIPLTAVLSPGAATAAPADPQVVFSEEFENGQGTAPVMVTDYVGPAPHAMTYTADPAWLTSCNGLIASRLNPAVAPPLAQQCGGWWPTVRELAASLGQWAGEDPATNHAVTAFTHTPPGAPKVQLETEHPVPIGGGSRFVTFSVDAAAVNCNVAHPLIAFYLLDGATAIPTFSQPIDTCAAPGAVINGISVGTYTSDAPVLFAGSQLGIRLVNTQAGTNGNDGAIDNVRVLDVTPQLGLSYPPNNPAVGQTTNLTLTVTNTSELREKIGWSFKVDLPDGLTPAGTPTSDCVSPSISIANGVVSAGGGIADGDATCTITVPVKAAVIGEYTTCPADVSARIGINPPPACASVTFVVPEHKFDAHAHAAKVTAPLIGGAPLIPSDISCTATPGSDSDTLLTAVLPAVASLGVLTTEASGTVGPDGLRTAKAKATTAKLNLLNGLITAEEITAQATATSTTSGTVTTAGTTTFTTLKVNGSTITNPPLNHTITIPLVAKIVLNERVPYGNGTGIKVNAIHVTTIAGVDVVVSHARASLTLPGQPCPSA
ncbi:choice-of-anchor P family protein [Herbidospora mongoliensis]|uniref:choice-of-anchor P family protein n=1 Tax=Herbidospora mongoliensis TaxID=688067 RepID=UPI00082DFF67|nr:choice-of-anchor P family protein [Herbidospora mongoliensis]